MIAPRKTVKQRRREVLERLDPVVGRTRQARAQWRHAAAEPAGPAAERLSRVLADLGPVFAAYGLYLSSRGDLLTSPDRRCFARIGRDVVPLPSKEVTAIVQAEINRSRTVIGQRGERRPGIASFEARPFDTRLLFQRHHARLADGRPVVVRIVRPDRSRECDLDLIPLLRAVVAPLFDDRRLFAQSIDDFRASYAAQTNGHALADALEILGREMRGFDSIRIPNVCRELSTPRVLILERVPGRRLEAPAAGETRLTTAGVQLISGDGAEDPSGEIRAGESLARLVCELWLRQAFDWGLVSTDPRAQDLIVLARTQVAIDEGTFATLPDQTRQSLLKYLLAVAVDEPRKALDWLLKEFESERSRTSTDELDRLFRQIAPDVDQDETANGPAGRLATTVQMQWRLAIKNGYRPLRHPLPVLRGLVCLSETLPGVGSGSDALLEGLKDYRLTRLLSDVHAMLEPLYWFSRIDRIADLVISAPRILDDALAAAVPNRAADERSVARPSVRDTRSSPWVVSTLVALVAIGIAYGRAPPVSGGSWGEALAAAVFLLFGYWMLRSAGNAKR
jgi:predicted unusual protein kinase regulating ubiquinone biosynthesis (AarF/ABC1/UbiB family)